MKPLALDSLRQRFSRSVVQCPICKEAMILRSTSRFTYPNGQGRLFWGCTRYPKCKATHGAHPDGTPLGIPADQETKQWRVKAHESFDKLWKQHDLTRKQSYVVLQKIMGMNEKEAHIARFDIAQCKRLIALCDSHGSALAILLPSTDDGR